MSNNESETLSDIDNPVCPCGRPATYICECGCPCCGEHTCAFDCGGVVYRIESVDEDTHPYRLPDDAPGKVLAEVESAIRSKSRGFVEEEENTARMVKTSELESWADKLADLRGEFDADHH